MKLLTQSFNQKKLKRIIIVHGGEEERKYIIEQLSQHVDMGNKEISTIKENETIRIN
jgi:hypothetical protein